MENSYLLPGVVESESKKEGCVYRKVTWGICGDENVPYPDWSSGYESTHAIKVKRTKYTCTNGYKQNRQILNKVSGLYQIRIMVAVLLSLLQDVIGEN